MRWITSEPLIFLYTIIFTINYTTLPQLVIKKICLNYHNQTLCNNAQFLSSDLKIRKESTEWWFYLLCCSLVPSIFTVLIWGPVTDIIGRKKAMICVPILNGLRAFVYLVNAYFMEAGVQYMMFGSVISCFYGEFQGVVALCYAYLADTTNTEERTMRMAFIEGSLFLAGIPAGLASGFLLKSLGFIPVFILNIAFNIIIFFYVAFLLPNDENFTSNNSPENESLVQNKSKNPSVLLLNPFFHLKEAFLIIIGRRYRRVLLPILFSFGLSVCAVYGELVVQTLYLSNQPFMFTPQLIGYYSATQAALRGFGVIFVIQLSHRILHWTDFQLALVGLLSQVICYTLIGMTSSILAVFLVNISGLAIPVATTTLRSMASKQVTSQNYGAVMGALEATDAIASLLTNVATLWTFDLTLDIYRGTVYFVLSFFALIAVLFLIIGKCASVSRI